MSGNARPRGRRRVVGTVAAATMSVLVASAGGTAGSAAATQRVVNTVPIAGTVDSAPSPGSDVDPLASASLYPCKGFGGLETWNPANQVLSDVFGWSTYPRIRVGDGNGNINWKLDPYRQPSWYTQLHSLRWLGQPIRDFRAYPATNTAKRQRVVTVAQDWIRDNPYPWGSGLGAGSATMYRTNALLCLREALVRVDGAAPGWLDTSLIQHAAWLTMNEWRDHNIGTDRNLALLGVGCVLNRPADRDTAVSRLATSIARVVDRQGANNEQSLGYANWNYVLWGKVIDYLRTCRINNAVADVVPAKRSGMQNFIDRGTGPDGRLYPLGDTSNSARIEASRSPVQQWVASNGVSGRPPAERVSIYGAGYVFGRSGWGQGARTQSDESAYTLRFGPGRAGHGHHDHMSMTWSTRGRQILVDPGLGEYTEDAWRAYAIGATAHNMVVVGGMKSTGNTKLTRAVLRPKADYFEMRDSLSEKGSRVRDVLFLSDPDVMIVFDRVSYPRTTTTFTQLWHLPPDQSVSLSKTGASAQRRGEALRTTIVQLPFGARATLAKASLTRGSTRPIQGWYWIDEMHRVPAPVVSLTRSGKSAQFLTAVVAGQGKVTAERTGGSARAAEYRIQVGSSSAVVRVGTDGSLSRVR